MTHKELIPKLIEHYQFGIDNLPMEDWEIFLEENGLWGGLCLCASYMFGVKIYYSDWIDNLTNGSEYLGDYPEDAKNRTECIELLQIRLDALKSIDLNTIEL